MRAALRRAGHALRANAIDVTPLRESPAFRRLFLGQAVSFVGTQMTQVAVPLQVYAITRSSLYVGLVGVFALVPLVAFGLYGGSIADAVDRRRLVLVTSTGTMVVSAVLLVQSLLGLRSVWLLFGCVAVQAGFAAVNNPARGAIIPALIRPEKLPAANTLNYGIGTLATVVGPLLAGVAVAAGSFAWAYGVDVVTFVASFYAALRLPALPPGADSRPAGLGSVLEGLRFVATKPVVLMTFVADLVAMLFASPRALFPALAYTQFGGAAAAGVLLSAQAAGAFLATLAGGAIGRVRRQGLGVVLAIAVWGVAIAAFGFSRWLWLALITLAVAAAADTVSAVYRSTILQVATPPGMRGRLQGLFFVVVAGGPRLGDVRAGVTATAVGPQWSASLGGVGCVVAIGVLGLLVPSFLRYDARAAAEARRVEDAAEGEPEPGTAG